MNNADLIVATLEGRRHPPRLWRAVRQRAAADGGDADWKGGIEFVLTAHEGSAGFAADVTARMTRHTRPVHRNARPRRDQSRDRHRLRLARPFADDRDHLHSEREPARPAHPDVDRPPHADEADHQGDAAAREGQDRRDAGRGIAHRHDSSRKAPCISTCRRTWRWPRRRRRCRPGSIPCGLLPPTDAAIADAPSS